MRARKLTFLCFIVLCLVSCKTQLLVVEPKGQQTSFWCWSACMEMVIGYHHKQNNQYLSTTQCELAVNWNQTHKNPPTEADYTQSSCCRQLCDITNRCNKPINGLINMVRYFGQLYTVEPRLTQGNKALSEAEIISQITNSKRPLIASIYSGSNPVCDDSHVVIVRGYEYNSDKKLFLSVIDPKSRDECVYLENKFPFVENDTLKERICNYIWEIAPSMPSGQPLPLRATTPVTSYSATARATTDKVDTLKAPKIVLPKALSNSLSGLFCKKPEKFQGEKLTTLDNQQFAQLVADKNYSVVPVKYLELQKMLSTETDKLTTSNVELKNAEIIDVIYNKSTPTTVNRFQLDNNLWKPILVSKQKDDLKLYKNNDNFNWKSKIEQKYWTNPTINTDNYYEKILFPPFIYEFHKVRTGQSFSYISSSNYKDLIINGEAVKKGQSYNEKDVLTLLKAKAIEYNAKYKQG